MGNHHAPPPTRYGTPAGSPGAGRGGGSRVMPSRVMQGRFLGSLQAKGNAFALPPSFTLPSGPGQKLPEDVCGKMESFFRADFSGVRVHVGPEASAIGAQAFTVGDAIVFAPGQYDPKTTRGQQILGHELAHVVQQRSGRVRNPFGAGLAVVQDPALEAEADRMGQRAVLSVQMAPAPGAPSWAGPRGAAALQPYKVLGSEKLYSWEPEKRPWGGYPYAIVPPASMAAQHRKRPTQSEALFLGRQDKTTAHVVYRSAGDVSLRVSDDNSMAIEDSDLGRRQPKTFFATDAVIAASNNTLTQVGSPVRLVRTGDTVTILTGWWSQTTLHGVRPSFNNATPNALPQNCNEIASTITGIANVDNAGENLMETRFRDLMGLGRHDDYSARAQDYVTQHGDAGNRNNRALSRRHLNQFANPGVGDTYMIHTVGQTEKDQLLNEQADLMDGELSAPTRQRLTQIEQRLLVLAQAPTRVRDFESNTDRQLNWSYHFAAVVARSGGDCVSLENYARGDMRGAGSDPRWYFQMYSQTKTGQTFHEFHKGKGDYANPITVAISR